MIIIGSGFAGIGLAYQLKCAGIHDLLILERNDDVGGVWNSNTYPGCTCDVPSHLYSFSFAPNPEWTSTYSPQAEIHDYLRSCVERFRLGNHLRLGVAMHDAAWDEDAQRWRITTSDGKYDAQVLVSAVGPLTEPLFPEVPGIDTFEGQLMHSARWDHSYDLTGKVVASIGSGASAIQYVPEIADRVGRLYVLQRTAPWIMPHPRRAISDRERALYRRLPLAQKAVRAGVYTAKEALVLGFVKRPALMERLATLAKAHLADQVPSPELRSRLTPDYTFGCKRLVPSNRWFPTLQKPNVELVSSALAEVRPHSIIDRSGVERNVDAIIFGTGYHVTDIPVAAQLRGRGGGTLAEHWAGSPRAYLGTSVPGFPNLFLMLGPHTGLGHSSMVYMIEAQATHIRNQLKAMARTGATTIEVDQRVHDDYNRELDRKMSTTVWQVGGCRSFYLDATGRNATLWPDWTWRFRRLAAQRTTTAYHLSRAGTGSRTAEAAR
ncbi:flavin-containing monooxygenase [Amycolatopsis sp. cmx-4-61]|uniref:flavin-containing monooxygenase n=1 Tax=Amycolatopsis sp. cmx-4-61 TaxID=2790937 RepID=UPI00397AB709